MKDFKYTDFPREVREAFHSRHPEAYDMMGHNDSFIKDLGQRALVYFASGWDAKSRDLRSARRGLRGEGV